MWLAHHGPEHDERCLHVRGVAVCRRCAVLYPVAVVAALIVLVADPPTGWLLAAMWLLPVPMVAEWIGEHLGRLRLRPPTARWSLTAIGAPALGVAVAIHAVEPFSLAACGTRGVAWTAVCGGAAMWSCWRSVPDVAPGWEEHHHAEEAARRARLEGMLAAADRRRSQQPD